MLYLRTLGDLSLLRDGPDGREIVGATKGLAAIAYLATTAGRRVPRRRLARLLWPRSNLKRGRRQLRQAIYYVRRHAGAPLVAQEGDPLVLLEDRLDVDVWRFERAVEAEDFERALRYHDGAFLAPLETSVSREFASWREAQEARIEATAKAACREMVGAALEDGEIDAAERHARRWVELDPFDAAAQSALIRVLLRADDWVGATAAYERYSALLEEELGEAPEPALTDRIERARRRIS